MLKKINRLPRRGFMTRYLAYKNSRLASVRTKPNGFSFSRFGVVIAKAIDKRSSRRNALRRTVYQALREGGLDAAPGRDVIIYLNSAALKASRKDIAFALKELLA